MGGLADCYVNRGPKGVLQAEITFDIANILVNGENHNRLEIFVAPGEEFLVDMRIKDVYSQSKCERKFKSMIIN